jgi:hypothetical protein
LEEYWFPEKTVMFSPSKPIIDRELTPVDVRDYVKGLDEKKLSFSQELMKIWRFWE